MSLSHLSSLVVGLLIFASVPAIVVHAQSDDTVVLCHVQQEDCDGNFVYETLGACKDSLNGVAYEIANGSGQCSLTSVEQDPQLPATVVRAQNDNLVVLCYTDDDGCTGNFIYETLGECRDTLNGVAYQVANISEQCFLASSPPSVGQDPHFVTFGGERYDYHGECDLVLLHNPDFASGRGMDIHIRTKIQKHFSVIKNAVIRIGDSTLEVSGRLDDDYEESPFWINGVPVTEIPDSFAGYPIISTERHSSKFALALGDGEFIHISIFKIVVNISFGKPSAKNFAGSIGLLGSFDTKERVGRDGVTVIRGGKANPFGKIWQVLDTEPMLFHNVEGPQYPEQCIVPDEMAMHRHLRASKVSRALAEDACSQALGARSHEEVRNCIFDVMMMEDVDMVGAYL